ncbi:MAG: dephospho-CoA kinase [Bacteroidales bacterium]|nr:dephospho-CoA kinase [Bacteroidales bacterium]
MILVLTGGIGSGKSTAARILNESFGCPVYDADSAVKRLYVSHPHLLSDIESDAGRKFTDADGVFRPSLMADWIFGNPDAIAEVENRVFPVLLEDFESWKVQYEGWVIFESATILEKPFFKGFGDAVLIIDAPIELRVERALARDKAGREKIMARVAEQRLMNDISQGRNIPEGAYVCRNDGNMDALRNELKEIFETIINKR